MSDIEKQKVPLGFIFSKTLGCFLYPQVMLLMFVPLLISIAIVLLFLGFTWSFWEALFSQGLVLLQPQWQIFLESLPSQLTPIFLALSPVLHFLVFLLMIAICFPLIIVFNLLIVSFLTSSYLVRFIAHREFKDLQKNGHSRFFKSILNTLIASGVYLVVWLLTIPFWLIPGVQLAVPILLTGWLNRQICSFDALTEFANDNEFDAVKEATSSQGFILGLFTAGINYIPFALFLSPVLTMVAFIFLQLETLSRLRKS